ncbi:hypothetical protein SDC9_158731 [bioreactor metagenome]|uniref:Uncharacterized protein n=1 Tax=bioreactor metagenome TaxID=1076179 RepID=A0A645FBY9_9ZZZZ
MQIGCPEIKEPLKADFLAEANNGGRRNEKQLRDLAQTLFSPLVFLIEKIIGDDGIHF